MIIITIGNTVFIRPDNIVDILTSNIVMGISALSMLLIIITGGIDVSVGAVITAVTVVIGGVFHEGRRKSIYTGADCLRFRRGAGTDERIAGGKAQASGHCCHAWHDEHYQRACSPGDKRKVYQEPSDYISGLGQQYLFKMDLRTAGSGGSGNLAFWAGAIILTWFILRHTVNRQGIYAVGGNEESAQRVGYRPKRVLTFAYTYGGNHGGPRGSGAYGNHETGRSAGIQGL